MCLCVRARRQERYGKVSIKKVDIGLVALWWAMSESGFHCDLESSRLKNKVIVPGQPLPARLLLFSSLFFSPQYSKDVW